ncbi:hypothetical protein F4604DRAFT_1681357 [Suillus subluteus]|nr:hypothetical protein F4604DRAFT_1681357 [Suillus subluteus]
MSIFTLTYAASSNLYRSTLHVRTSSIGNIAAYLPATVQTTQPSHALTDNEIAPVKRRPLLPAEECPPLEVRILYNIALVGIRVHEVAERAAGTNESGHLHSVTRCLLRRSKLELYTIPRLARGGLLRVGLDRRLDWSTAANGHSTGSTQPLLVSNSSTLSLVYNAVVDRAHVPTTTDDIPISLFSILTIRPTLDPSGTAEPTAPCASLTDNGNTPTGRTSSKMI